MGGLSRAVAFRCQGKPPPARSAGRSVVRTAAYNARDRLSIEETHERADYRRGHSELTFSGIFAPKDVPEWLRVTADMDRAQVSAVRERLWNEVERVEGRVNSQFARALEINFPHELSQEGRERVVKDWVRENFVRAGMVADVNLHAPHNEGDERNHHGHILLTLRRIDSDGWARTKERDWNRRELFVDWKIDLAQKCANMLEREGHQVEAERWRFGYMDLPHQREKALERGDLEYAEACNREPTQHIGPQIKEIEARGVVSEVQERRGLEAANENSIRVELTALRSELADLQRQEARLLQGLRQGPGFADTLDRAADAIEGTMAIGEAIATKALGFAADEYESLLEMAGDAVSATKPDPELAKARAADKAARAERAEAQTADWRRYLADDEYRRQLAQRERLEREQRERDEYQRKDRDRDR